MEKRELSQSTPSSQRKTRIGYLAETPSTSASSTIMISSLATFAPFARGLPFPLFDSAHSALDDVCAARQEEGAEGDCDRR
jgi:hypothetical protein